jgi:transcriptional regulator with XRE-family HTH domain
MTAAEQLQNYRKEHKLNQSEFAAQLGISQQRLSYYESGMEPPTTIIKRVLEVTGMNLITGKNGSVMPDGLIAQLSRELELKDQLITSQQKQIDLLERLLQKQ